MCQRVPYSLAWLSEVAEEKEAVIDILQTQCKENLLGARTTHMSIILGKGFWKRVYSRDRQYKGSYI